MPVKNKFGSAILLFLALSVLAAAVWKVSQKATEPPAELIGVLRPEFRPYKPFQLVDQHNAAFTEQRFNGKWSFIFFGYTSCPDICPVTLSVINSVKRLLEKQDGDLASDMQVVFVSVDPQRDSPEKLAEYVKFFNSDFIGVTGEKEQIDILASQSGAGYIMEAETAPGEYLVGHTSAIFLTDPQGRLVAAFSQPHKPQTIVSQYEKIRTYIKQEK